MMRYLPHTPDEITAMLKTIGAKSLDELYQGIPTDLRLKDLLDLPPALSEFELRHELEQIASRNISLHEAKNFIGGGAYHHYVPSVIPYLVRRGEFLTAYTPYQPEVSQGTLQAIFEYQTMMCALTGMEVANASNYDASTATVEAVLMASRVTRRKKVLVARALHPHYRAVMQTYLHNLAYQSVEIPLAADGGSDLAFVKDHLDDSIAAVVLQSPNFFGVIEDLRGLGATVQGCGALFITVAAESLSLAVLPTPGELGADIAVAEGMSFGIGLNYGGPYLGIFTTREKYVRSMPGRVVGETRDADGRRGYVLTLATREQHIRREKATSNICTNQGLCALMSAVYLALMGPRGLERAAVLNMERLQQLEMRLKKIHPGSIPFTRPKFNETVVQLKVPAKEAVINILKDGIFPGIDLSTYFPELDRHLLVCTTEMNTPQDVDILAEKLGRFV